MNVHETKKPAVDGKKCPKKTGKEIEKKEGFQAKRRKKMESIQSSAHTLVARLLGEAEEGEGGDEGESKEGQSAECPACGGQGSCMGKLGNRAHYRCRQCGMDFSHTE